jgi:hypothetical protein
MPPMGVTVDDARAIAAALPRSYEALVRDRVTFRSPSVSMLNGRSVCVVNVVSAARAAGLRGLGGLVTYWGGGG